jgi:membrane protein YdbS with pleckstrin-like domain
MGRRLVLREGEVKIISVTPVSRGVGRPLLCVVATVVLVVEGARHISFLHRHELLVGLIVIGPFVLVLLTRVWRWRSHKVHVTNQRIVLEGGVLGHHQSAIELRDVIATRVDQRVTERLTRRGSLLLETAAGPVALDQVRHPSALCRLIDLERAVHPELSLPLDTIFSFDQPEQFDYEVRPRRRRSARRYE